MNAREDEPGVSEAGSARRFHVALQKSRLAVYTIAYPLVVVLAPSGFHRIGWGEATALWAGACASALLFLVLYRRGTFALGRLDLSALWIATDVAFITILVALDGGAGSLWFILYVSNIAAAAFVGGMRWAVAVMVADALAYLGMLVALGQVTGLDRTLLFALGRLGVLYGSAFYAIKGIADLREQRIEVRRLRAEDQRKVESLSRLTEELAEQHAEVEAASRMKSDFLARISHELRTPMNSIIGFTQILRGKLEGEIDERLYGFLGNVHMSATHLLGLINDLLDLSKIEAGRMEVHPERVDLGAALEEACKLIEVEAEKRSQRVTVELERSLPPLVTDRAKLEQIVINLLSNAVKFSPEGSRITVRAEPTSAGSPLGREGVRIDVADQGPGIRPEDQEAIFEEFRQLSDRTPGGTGLGLPLARKLAELQGGALDVRSKPGEGATFSVYLPVLPPAGVASGPERSPAVFEARGEPDGGRPRVLIVEDDASAALLLAESLSSSGYEPIRVSRGEDALRIAAEEPPAVITLDLLLPGLDGWEVLKRLKASPQTRHVPVVIISMVADRELGVALGAADIFLKPVARDELLRRIEELVMAADVTHPTVLVVDDDEAVHDLLAEHLSGWCRLLAATDGEQGLEIARRERPDLIVLDLMMPRMDGFEVAASLQATPATAEIPIVVLTARDMSVSDRESLRGRIVAVEHKSPSWPAHVAGLVDTLLRRRGRSEER